MRSPEGMDQTDIRSHLSEKAPVDLGRRHEVPSHEYRLAWSQPGLGPDVIAGCGRSLAWSVGRVGTHWEGACLEERVEEGAGEGGQLEMGQVGVLAWEGVGCGVESCGVITRDFCFFGISFFCDRPFWTVTSIIAII